MSSKSARSGWVSLAFVLALSFGISASAFANPISKVGTVSKTVVAKTYDGAKSVVTESGRIVKDAGATAWNATDSLVSHVRSAF